MTPTNNNLREPISQTRLIELCIENANLTRKSHPETFDPSDLDEVSGFCYGFHQGLVYAGASWDGKISMDAVVEGVQEGVKKTAAA